MGYGQNKVRKPIFGHTFFGHNSAIFGLIGLRIFMGTPETINYRLMTINSSYDTYISFLIFWGIQTWPKSWPIGWTFSANGYLENRKLVFEISSVYWVSFSQKIDMKGQTRDKFSCNRDLLFLQLYEAISIGFPSIRKFTSPIIHFLIWERSQMTSSS